MATYTNTATIATINIILKERLFGAGRSNVALLFLFLVVMSIGIKSGNYILRVMQGFLIARVLTFLILLISSIVAILLTSKSIFTIFFTLLIDLSLIYIVFRSVTSVALFYSDRIFYKPKNKKPIIIFYDNLSEVEINNNVMLCRHAAKEEDIAINIGPKEQKVAELLREKGIKVA